MSKGSRNRVSNHRQYATNFDRIFRPRRKLPSKPCKGCGRPMALSGGSLCAACDAYQEHTA